jgi:hypothetical protein
MFTYPYQILKKRIAADVIELREIDWFLDQTSTKDKNVIVACPACYIEFVEPEMRQLNHQIQSGILDFKIHLVTSNIMDKGEQRIKKTAATDHMVLFDKIYRSLHKFSAKISYLDEFVSLFNTDNDQRIFNSITRTQPSVPHTIRKTLMVSVQTFRCVVYDHATLKTYTVPDPKPSLETESNLEGSV